MLTRHPLLGIEFAAWQKLWRLVGVDHLHVNGLDNKFWEPDDSVVRSIQALQTAVVRQVTRRCLSSPRGSGAGRRQRRTARTGTLDLMYVAGGGIMAHPGGPCGGTARHSAGMGGRGAGYPTGEYALDARGTEADDRETSGAADDEPAAGILRRRLHRLGRRDGGVAMVRAADGAVSQAPDVTAACTV